MGMMKEFREFALKGNVLDLAVGVIIGAAFGKIVTSMIEDLIMPLVSIPGDVDFSNKYVMLTDAGGAAMRAAPVHPNLAEARKLGPVFAYGNFITATINFLILAFCIFLVVKLFNTARRRFEAQKPAPAPPGPTPDQKLLTEIRDLLAARR
jgi:large conductance mechanosensitive channel